MQVGFAGANPYSRSLIERIRLSKETQWRRLMIWGAVVAASSAAIGLLVSNGCLVPGRVVLSIVYTFSASAALGALVYCLAIFALERRVGDLLAAIAFSALGSGAILQAAVDLQGTQGGTHSWTTAIARLLAVMLFVGESYSTSKWRAANRIQSVGQFAVAGLAVLAFPLVTLPYASDGGALGALLPTTMVACRVADMILGALAAALMCWALITHHRRYMTSSDGLAGLLCYYFVPAGMGLLLSSISSERFDTSYTMGQVCLLCSWAALVVGNGVENAFAHKEGKERLEEFEALHDVSWSLVGAGTVRELLDLFVSTLVNRLGAAIAAVYLPVGEDALELVAICGSDESEPGTKYSLVASGPWPGFHTGHSAKAYSSKQVQVAHDVFVDVEFVPWRVIAADDGCAASIPLVDHDRGIGVLNVYFSDARQLSTARLRLLATIAAAATSAVEYAMSKNARANSDSIELDAAA